MKHLKLITSIFLSAILFVAFSGNSPVNAGKEDSSSITGSPTASVGDASFSCKIDGKDFSGKGTDTANNSSRFTGTFSGDLVDPDTKKVVQLTDGKFDLPYSKK